MSTPSPPAWLSQTSQVARSSTLNISGDGDNRLVLADLGTGDFNMKLRVYKGTQQVTENTIIDLPTGVVTFHMDTIPLRFMATVLTTTYSISRNIN